MNRYAALAIVAVVLGAATFASIHWMKHSSDLYAGDTVETRQCRWCGGTGQEGQQTEGMPQEGMPGADGRCVGCGGAGKVEVVIPGPNHPSKVKGVVYDTALAPADESDEAAAVRMMSERNPMKPVAGAINEATVVFTAGEQKIETHSNATGRFRVLIPPGSWKVSATAPGFATWEGELEVPVLEYPIYREKARIKGAPESMEQEQTEEGSEIRCALKKL